MRAILAATGGLGGEGTGALVWAATAGGQEQLTSEQNEDERR